MRRCAKTLSILLFILAAMACRGQTICPWMNQATASGLIATPMDAPQMQGTFPNITCVYTSTPAAEITTLTIQVAQMAKVSSEFSGYMAKCSGGKVLLKAIGNEAEMCPVDGLPRTRAEIVVGRVRDRAFVVTLSRTGRLKAPIQRDTMESQTHAVAEQIAGFLF